MCACAGLTAGRGMLPAISIRFDLDSRDRIEDREVVVGIIYEVDDRGVTECVGKILIVWARGRGARIASSLK